MQKLALLLTADSETAKICLVRAFRECIASSSVFRESVLSWTRRIVIRNAICVVLDQGGRRFVDANDDADNGPIAFSPDDSPDAIAVSKSVLDLSDFDRFVFVICVLERYSMYDCALLLGRSPRDVDDARERVGNQVGQIDELGDISEELALV